METGGLGSTATTVVAERSTPGESQENMLPPQGRVLVRRDVVS